MNNLEKLPIQVLTIVVGVIVVLALLSPLQCRIGLSVKSLDPNDPNITNINLQGVQKW